ncbi:MLX-interacting protein-like isoform X2 [Amphiura filiformis]|uniref:MLX-interacting protein-like isoform X2 n=1 Tax=Amphiura filiformis TaxID=82378 RepID=UPI003B226B49
MARDEILGAQSFEHGQWREPSSRDGSPPSPTNLDADKVEQIHSGHFMISNPHRIKKHGYNFEDALKSPLTSYRFGAGEHESFEIDGSFAKLFQCLSLAYNGAAIVSPKWKTFKGMKLTWKDKIRLNNAIWREWHCQFVFGRKPILCQFSFPISEAVHSTPQNGGISKLADMVEIPTAVVLEGKYWKRTLGTVVKEYMKWRAFYKKRRSLSFSSDGGNEPASPLQDPLLQEILRGTHQSPDPVPMILDEEALLSEFTDTLFTSLDSKFLFPNPKELSHMSTNADIMQPGLVQLQPSLEELMDTFEPLQDVMKSVAHNFHTPSTFVFTGNNSIRPVVQAAHFLGGASSSSVHDVTPPSTPSVQMPQQNLIESMTLQDSVDSLSSNQSMSQQQQQNQQMLEMHQQQQQQQPHQFNTQQQISSNQQLDGQQFIITQQDLQTHQQQQQQQQPLTPQDISSQLAATQQQLQEVSRQMSAAQQHINNRQSAVNQQSVVDHQFNTQQLQQQQQQIQLIQQQQQQLILQQQTQQNQLQNLGIPLNSVGHPATLHSATGDTTHILLNNADLASLQSHINNSNGMSPLQNNTQQQPQQPMQGINTQPVLNPLTSVQVRIAPGDDVKVGTPIHQLAANVSQQNQIPHVRPHRTLSSQSGVTVRTVNQAQNVAGTLTTSGQSSQLQGLPTILSTGGNQTQAIKLLQQVANQVSQNNQQQPQQQQQSIAVQQTENKGIITQIFEQNMIPTGNNSFVSVQQPVQQQRQQQRQRKQQPPIPVAITKAVPQAKTRTAQPVTKNQLVTSVAKVPSQMKATSGTAIPMGAKAKTKRQPKPKQQPAKIAPAPPSSTSTNNNITAPSSTALLTQLLTQGRFESALRASSAPQPIKPLPPAATTTTSILIQPIKTESEFKSAKTCTMPVALSVTSSLPGGVPFIGVSQTPSLFTASPASTSTTNSMSILGISSVLSTPSKSDENKPSFTIGMVSSPPTPSASGSSAGEGDLTSMEQLEMMENSALQTPKKDTHISAEQKRRVNIKSGFDMLNTLVPSLIQNPNAKVSKAQMLQKAVEYTKRLQVERSHVNEEIDTLKQEVAALNVAISETQSQLPASGVPVTRQRFDMMKDIFDEYVRDRTTHNWKFWIFSIIIRPLFESYNASVSTASTEELFRTVLSWLDQHCSLLALRPTVLSSLTLLSRTTSILSDPGQVPQQAAEAVSKRNDDDNKR